MKNNQLEPHELEEHLVHIITGKKLFSDSSGNLYAVCFPEVRIRDTSRLIYIKTLKKMQASGVPTKSIMQQRIKELKLLPIDFYARLAKIDSQLESFTKAREMTNSKHQAAELNFEMEKVRKVMIDLKMKELSLMAHTAEVKAEEAKTEYIVSNCTLTGPELSDKIWDSYKDFQESTETKIITLAKHHFSIMSNGISPAIIRSVSRTSDWRRRWKAAQQTGSPVFHGSSADWDINKVEICYWSDFYDSIFSYHTPPPETIIDDDESLFEWIRNVNRLNATGGAQSTSSGSGATVNRVNTPYKVRPKDKEV